MNLSEKTRGSDVFFPAAAWYAALAVPLAVNAMTRTAWPPGLIGAGHAHEMLFGFALALIAGYLLGPMARWRVLALLILWLVARFAYALAPAGSVAAVSSPLFALVLAVCLVPKFKSAKRWRNRAIAPLLLAICILPAMYVMPAAGDVLPVGIVLLALLMAFMGGRVIAPAAAGAFYRRGMNLEARVQPRLEGAIIVLLAGAAVILLLPSGRLVAAVGIGAAGAVILLRLLRWRLWVIWTHADIMGLAAGYVWLALGLLMFAALLATGESPVPALHIITVGALGTLSICVMTRVHMLHHGRNPARAPWVGQSVVLIAVASVLRFAAALNPELREPLLWFAAVAWSLAYLIAAILLLSVKRSG